MENSSILRLLTQHRQEEKSDRVGRLTFPDMEGYDVYNSTAPFFYEGRQLLCARVEKRQEEAARTVFFEKAGEDRYCVAKDFAEFPLQDPFLTRIGGEYVLGGTEVYPYPGCPGRLGWHTSLYTGKDLHSLKKCFDGPEGMKDIRPTQLSDGRVGLFTRPQGEKGGRGKIGFTVVESLRDVTAAACEEAPLLPLFSDTEWGGVNEVHLLPDHRLGILGHIACFAPEEVRHYYPMSFLFDPDSRQITALRILAERSDLLPGESKRPDLEDVLFSGGLVSDKLNDEKMLLYVGVSDCEIQYLSIQNPFFAI